MEVLNQKDLMRIIEIKSIMNGQIKRKVEPALNVGTSIGVVYAP